MIGVDAVGPVGLTFEADGQSKILVAVKRSMPFPDSNTSKAGQMLHFFCIRIVGPENMAIRLGPVHNGEQTVAGVDFHTDGMMLRNQQGIVFPSPILDPCIVLEGPLSDKSGEWIV